LLSRQHQPQPRGDDREPITRARQTAEALFTSKPSVGTAIAPPAVADQSARKPRVLRVIPPQAPARYDVPDAPAAPTPPPVEIPPSQIARIRTWVKYGMKVAQVAQVYGVPVDDIERLLGKA
jgi:hypothetical protein